MATTHQLTTIMVHYSCDECPMTATMVATSTEEVAWRDHMASHIGVAGYKRWVWEVVQLPLHLDLAIADEVEA